MNCIFKISKEDANFSSVAVVFRCHLRKFLSVIAITVVFAVTATDAFSQVKGKWRGGVDMGVGSIFPKQEYRTPVGMVFDWSLGYNLHKNMNVGFKFGHTAFMKICDNNHNHCQKYRGNINITSTYTYYFGKRTNLFIPFVGGGLGYYLLTPRAEVVHLYILLDIGTKFSEMDCGVVLAAAKVEKWRLGSLVFGHKKSGEIPQK